jgi:glutaredoxin 3
MNPPPPSPISGESRSGVGFGAVRGGHEEGDDLHDELVGYRDTAKPLLEGRDIAFDEVDIETWEDPRGRLEELSGGRTVPQIVVGEHVLGGFGDLTEAVRSGRLTEIFATAK